MSSSFGVAELVATTELADQIRKDLVDAPTQSDLTEKFESLTTALRNVEAIVSQPDLSNQQEAELRGVVASCIDALEKLETVFDKQEELKESADIAASDPNKGTQLHWACQAGHVETVQQLLDKGAKLEFTNTYAYGYTPLHCALINGHVEVIQLLLKHGINMEFKDTWGRNPLSIAAGCGQVAVVKLLLAVDGIKPDLKDKIGRTPLVYAAHNGNKAIVELLLATTRVDIDSMDYYHSTPLSVAARIGHEDIVACILSKSHALNTPDLLGRTPLWWARRNGYTQIVNLLLEEYKEIGIPTQEDLPTTSVSVPDDGSTRNCDVCMLSVLNKATYHHCTICNGGDFDVCQDCFGMSAHCLDPVHTLIKETNQESASLEAELVHTHSYQPLSGDKVIRVATILPGDSDTPLTVALKETVLGLDGNQQADSKYETLSYEWGQNKRDRPIICDGETFLITRNLESALQRLRRPDIPLQIWIDAMCINQGDIKERNHQVTMMPLIYKSATRVNIWLGEENESTAEGISMLETLRDLYGQVKKTLRQNDASKDWLAGQISSMKALQMILGDEMTINKEKRERWEALEDILTRTYFERTWITQEILLSWNATVVIGSHHFEWRLLQKAAIILMKCQCLPVKRTSLAFFRLGILAQSSRMSWKGRRYTIVSVLQTLILSRCFDPRDMVYGILAIAQYPHGAVSNNKPIDIGLPAPDYSKPVEQVYQETCAALLVQSQDLKLFFNMQVPRLRNFPSMPTWVIDWSPSPEGWWHDKDRFLGAGAGKLSPRDTAANQKNLFVSPIPHASMPLFPATANMPISISGRVLKTQGLSIGSVTWTSHALSSTGLVPSLAKLNLAFDALCGNGFVNKYINGELMLHVLCKTLLMNRDDDEAEARGFKSADLRDWTPMFESFLGVLVCDHMVKRAEDFKDMPRELSNLLCVEKSGCGLFLAAAKTLENQRVFQADGVGAIGMAALDVKVGDRVVLLRGAYAPVVLRLIEDGIVENKGERWEIVCEAYVHAAMEMNDRIYSEGLCGNWKEFMIC